MKVTLIMDGGARKVICDGAEFAGQPGKFIEQIGSGKSSLTRGMQLVQAVGRQPLVKPDTEKVSLSVSFAVKVAFATEGEAFDFRMSFPAELPRGQCGVVMEISGTDTTYDDASIQAVAIDQAGAECTVAYTLRISLAE